MRVQYGNAMRPTYYDRNTSIVPITVDTAPLSPHTETPRFTFNVPKKRKGIIEFLQVYLKRGLSATAASRATVEVKLTRGGGSRVVARCYLYETYSDSYATLQLSGVTLDEEETFQIITYDYSSDGSVEYHVFGSLLTFDA